MYKRPPKRIQRARLIALYSGMTLAVICIVAMLVMVVANYRYNGVTGTFEQRGLVQFASVPSGATVEVDTTTLPGKTATKSSVEPGEHRFAVWREGYETWSLTTEIPAGSLVWLNNTRLVPKKRPVEMIHEYDQMAGAVASPNSRAIILQLDALRPEFRLVDISHNQPKGQTIALPEQTYRLSDDELKNSEQPAVRYELGAWDESDRYMIVWRVLGESRELIVLNTESPVESVNVSREFSLPIESAAFSGRSGNILYVKTGGDVRKVDVSGGTITRSLVSSVEQFTLQNTNTVLFTSRPDGTTAARTLGVYRDGDDSPVVLRTVRNQKDTAAIASSTYYGTTYTAIVEGKKMTLYKGHYDRGIDGLTVIASRTFSVPIDSVEFNRTGSHVLMRAGSSFMSYNIDRMLFSQSKLDDGSSADLFWIDAAHLGFIHNGTLTMRDIDGTNVFSLNVARSGTGKAVTLSRNGTFMYSLGTDSNKPLLQRIRMILQ
jgi:hypothetical protein